MARAAAFLALGWLLVSAVRLAVIFPWTPEQLIVSDVLQAADLIVFLDGTYYERMDRAFTLAEQGFARYIFTAGFRYRQSREHLADKLLEIPSSVRFYLGGGATSTYEEALETRRFVERNEYRSLILVTTFHHSHRAAWTFRRVMPNVRIVSSPVMPAPGELESQRHVSGSRLMRYFRLERRKFLAYFLLYGVAPHGLFACPTEPIVNGLVSDTK